jgi:hypothetical protein
MTGIDVTPDWIDHVARPGGTIRRDTTVPYVDADTAHMVRDEAVEAALAAVTKRLRCTRCEGHGAVADSPEIGADTTECRACAGTGIDPDATWADVTPNDWRPAGATTARAVDAERARLRRTFAEWIQRLDPTEAAPPDQFIVALRVVIGEIDDARTDRDWQALTAGDLHELASYPMHVADMLEAGDHRDPTASPTAGDLTEARRLRALAVRARRHLGPPTP